MRVAKPVVLNADDDRRLRIGDPVAGHRQTAAAESAQAGGTHAVP